ncbi:MAG TPA: ABC transporter transmembrane domain-containing protein, partial [Thermoanaerobaculia bacterium]
MKRLAALAPYILRYRRKLITGILAILGSVVVGLQGPRLVGSVIDSLRQHPSRGTLLAYAGLLVAIALVQGIFSYLQRMILVGMSRDVEFDLRNDYFVSLETKPAAFFHDHPTGDLMARATNDLQAVRMVCGPAIMYSVNTVFTAAGALYFMTRIDPRLTLLALITM